jgi:hypothetical protein
MSGDYKYDIQMIAEELAQEKYEKEFYDLTSDQQYEVYTLANQHYIERLCDRADYLRKAQREGAL